MNARDLLVLLVLSASTAQVGCINDKSGKVADTGTDGGNSDGGSDTDGGASGSDGGARPETDDSDSAYTTENGVLTLKGTYNAFQGQTIGVFGDNFGTDDGFSEAVATIPAQSDGSIPTNLAAFGTGKSYRLAWATLVVDGDAPDDYILENASGMNVASHDPLGLTVWVRECGVDKLNFCVRLTPDLKIEPGECALTYTPPEGCEDEDTDGDTDVDADGDGGDTGTEDCPDADGDGYTDAACGGDDCDDGWYWNNPGAAEANDEVDNDCDGEVDEGCESDDAENEICD